MTTQLIELKQAMELVGGEEAFIQEARRYRSDTEYVENNLSTLLEKYPERWIAVYDGEVQVASKSIKTLFNQMCKKQLPENNAVITFLTTKEKVTLF